MSVRAPCVAGPRSFYPSDPAELKRVLASCLPDAPKLPAIAAVVPHAGYVYSGGVAGAVYRRLDVPRDVVLLCFHHRGLGAEFGVWPAGAWETPLGRVEVPEDLVAVAREAGAEPDEAGHRNEHSGEVQVPFLQTVRADVRIAPVALSVGLGEFDRLCAFGERLARSAGEFLVIASTDLNHYEPQAPTLVKDQYAIDAIARLDAEGLRRAIEEHDVSMCGYAPTIAAIAYARAKGAREAKLIEHKTSGDVSGDFDRVVGYAGFIIPCTN